MNKKEPDLRIYLGETPVLNGDSFFLDLKKDRLHFIYLFGESGSGKSVFHTLGIYGFLIANNTPEDLGLMFIDHTQVDWQEFESFGFFVEPPITDPTKGLEYLEKVALEGNPYHKPLIIHIEECNVFDQFPERSIKAMHTLLDKAEEEELFIVYSSSRHVPALFEHGLTKLISRTDLRVVFKVSSSENSMQLLGNNSAYTLKIPGEKMVFVKNMQIPFDPFNID